MDLKDTAIVCIPASCKRTNDRRFKAFSADVCAMCGAINGFSKIQDVGKRNKVHRSRHHEHTAEDNVMIDAAWFQGRRVIVIDDICTTGKTADAFIKKMQDAGADVRLAWYPPRCYQHRGLLPSSPRPRIIVEPIIITDYERNKFKTEYQTMGTRRPPK